MDPSFTIKSVRDGSTLELLDPSNDSLLARLSGPGFSVETQVYEPELFHFGEFFANLASDWKGWPSPRKWLSLEHHLSIEAGIDSLGHVGFKVDLQSGTYPHDWKMSVKLEAEAGQLENIARDARQFAKDSAAQ